MSMFVFEVVCASVLTSPPIIIANNLWKKCAFQNARISERAAGVSSHPGPVNLDS